MAPLVLWVVASLVWSLLWWTALAEGAADSASLGVIGCTEGCGGRGVFGWGCLSWGLFYLFISDWRGRGFWLVESVGVVLAFWVFFGCMLCRPMVMWCIVGGCVVTIPSLMIFQLSFKALQMLNIIKWRICIEEEGHACKAPESWGGPLGPHIDAMCVMVCSTCWFSIWSGVSYDWE